ncbi:MAG: hypothetical protein U0Q18_14030 [Bryobacteraceae bacterium]
MTNPAAASEVIVPGLDLLPSTAQASSIGKEIQDSTLVSDTDSPVLDGSRRSAELPAGEVFQNAGHDQNRAVNPFADSDRTPESHELAFGARLYRLESDDAPSPSTAPTSLSRTNGHTPLQTGSTHPKAMQNVPPDAPPTDSDTGGQNATANAADSGLDQREATEPGSFVTAVSRPGATQAESRKPQDFNKGFDNRDPVGSPVTAATPRHPDTRPDGAAKEMALSNMDDLQPKSGSPPHAVSLRVTDGDRSVDIRMAERGGEIRVMVQTPDRHLGESLRQELPDLVTRLRHSGFQAETWKPQPASRPDSSQQNDSGKFSGFSHQNQGSGDRKRQQRNTQARWISEWTASATDGVEVSL